MNSRLKRWYCDFIKKRNKRTLNAVTAIAMVDEMNKDDNDTQGKGVGEAEDVNIAASHLRLLTRSNRVYRAIEDHDTSNVIS